jgi:hypothetical protein
MSSTPKKVIPAKRPATKGGTTSSQANRGAIKKPATTPTKPKPTAKPAPVKKPIPAKSPSEKSEGGIFSKLFGLFKKKAPKEESAKESTLSETKPQVTSEVATPIIEAAVANTPVNEFINESSPEIADNTISSPELEVINHQSEAVITIPTEEVKQEEIIVQEEPEALVEFKIPEVQPVEEKPVEAKVQETLFPVEELQQATITIEEPIGIKETSVQESIVKDEPNAEEHIVYKESAPSPVEYTAKTEEPEYITPSPSSDETGKIAEIEETPVFSTTPEKEYAVEIYPTNENVETAKEEPIITPQAEYIPPAYSTYNEKITTPLENTSQELPKQQNSSNKSAEENKKKRGILLPFFLIVSLIGNGVLAWLLMNKQEEVKTVIVLKDKIVKEKEDVMADLLKLKEEYATLQTNNTGLQKELEEKRAEIESMIEQAKKHKNDAFVIAKLRKETETLRSIMKHFVVEIDSLNTLNKTIVAEKNKVVQDLNTQINKTTELEKDNDNLIQTVNKGSVLKATMVKAEGIRMRGGVKEVDVKYAGRAEKVKVTFSLGENSIAKKGMRTVYIKMTGPDGKDVTASESDLNSFSYNGTRGFYAEKKEVDYQGIDTPVDIICGSPKGFISGKYLVDVVCDGNVIGQTELFLK